MSNATVTVRFLCQHGSVRTSDAKPTANCDLCTVFPCKWEQSKEKTF